MCVRVCVRCVLGVYVVVMFVAFVLGMVVVLFISIGGVCVC